MPKRRTKKSISNAEVVVIPKKNLFMKHNSQYKTSWGNQGLSSQASAYSLAFSPQRFMTMNYYQTYTLSQTLGTSTTQQWRMNSLNDIDYTTVVGDHRPYYYDQMKVAYGRYKVYGFRMDYQYTCDNGSGTGLDSMIVFRPTADGTTPTATAAGFQVEVERPNSIYKTFSAGGNPVRGTIKVSCRKVLGLSKGQYEDDDRTGADVDANPLTIPYLNCIPLSTAAAAVHVLRCKITVFAKWYARKIVSGS